MERNVFVDKLKGYACFLVLFGHVIMGIRVAGIDIPNFFFGLERFIWSFHVALFMFLSGNVYRMTGEWRGKKTKLGFIKHILVGLGIPYVTLSGIYILINAFVGQVNTQLSFKDFLLIWKTPVVQYWFLYALFFLFCIWTILSGLLKNWLITLLVVATGYILSALGISLGDFDIVFQSALAFGLGSCLDVSALTKIPTAGKIAVLLAHVLTGTALVYFNMVELAFVKEAMVLFGIYSSIIFISLIGEIKAVNRFLTFMNKYSFQTYLLHTIFTAGARIVMLRLGVAHWWLHILVGTLFGIAFSVLAAEIAKKFKFLNFFFFPTKYCRQRL